MKHLFFSILAFISFAAYGQTYTLSGYVTDPSNGESLIGVNILAAGTNKGVVTNNYGFYSLSLPKGFYQIVVSYIGYQQLDTTLNLNSNISLNVPLQEKTQKLNDVVVTANSDREKVRKTGMGMETLSMKSISNLPVVFGESDVLKIVQLMPGVQPASEGSSGFNVRGGNYDQNLLLLDEAVVYNPGHIFSFVSVFNDDAINSMTLYKGTMPAEYGGRASSVLDISMKEGNCIKFSGKGSIGLIASKLTIEGVRFNKFNFMGKYDEYSYNENKEPLELIKSYDDFETVKSYQNVEPRLNIRYLLNDKSSVKIAYTHNSQFVHLISNSGSALPLDFWVPSSKLVRPQLSNQFSVGYSLNFFKDMLLFTAEAYGKNLENLIEFGDDFVPSYTNNSELDYVYGEGTSHGFELMFKKNTGKLQGWIGYTFSNTNRKFEGLNNGKEFPANTDIRNDLSFVATFALNDQWTFGADFVFKSGKPFTIPTSRYYMDGELVDQYTERNNVRLPAYHRLDISATYKPTPKYKRFSSEWVFAVYNVYNRMNTTFVYFDNQGTTIENNFVTKTKSVTLLPFMPSIAYKFNF